jgi:hypothetical protein
MSNEEKVNETLENDNKVITNDENKIIIRHYSGINTENFQLKKANGKRIQFSIFKLNGMYYVNINGEHIMDYRRFISIQSITNDNTDVKIQNVYIGELKIVNCDIDLVKKSLIIMAEWMKKNVSWLNYIMYVIFH